MKAKKRVNAPSSQGSSGPGRSYNPDREERLSLLGYGKPSPSRLATTTTPPPSGHSTTLSFRKERRKTSDTSGKDDEEERVSLMGKNPRRDNNSGRPAPAAGPARLRKQPMRGLIKGNYGSPPWTVSRTMKYLALMIITACLTFLLLRKESKAVHWEEYHNMLEPEVGKETRCFVSFVWERAFLLQRSGAFQFVQLAVSRIVVLTNSISPNCFCRDLALVVVVDGISLLSCSPLSLHHHRNNPTTPRTSDVPVRILRCRLPTPQPRCG
jgi:hypothetical protein